MLRSEPARELTAQALSDTVRRAARVTGLARPRHGSRSLTDRLTVGLRVQSEELFQRQIAFRDETLDPRLDRCIGNGALARRGRQRTLFQGRDALAQIPRMFGFVPELLAHDTDLAGACAQVPERLRVLYRFEQLSREREPLELARIELRQVLRQAPEQDFLGVFLATQVGTRGQIAVVGLGLGLYSQAIRQLAHAAGCDTAQGACHAGRAGS